MGKGKIPPTINYPAIIDYLERITPAKVECTFSTGTWTHWHGTDRGTTSNCQYSVEQMIDSRGNYQAKVPGTSIKVTLPAGASYSELRDGLVQAAQALR